MANVFIILGGGFQNHHAVVELDDRTILDEVGVTSSPLTDLATELPPAPASAPASRLTVSIRDPETGEGSTVGCDLSTDHDRHVVVYVDAGDIRFMVGDRPFGFA